MENETSPKEKSWFSDVSWRSAIILAFIAAISGGTGGGVITATKAVKAEGLSQDQADIRYITKDEANQRGSIRDKQYEAINKKLDEKTLSRELFEAIHSNDIRRIDDMDKKLDQILQNQNRGMR